MKVKREKVSVSISVDKKLDKYMEEMFDNKLEESVHSITEELIDGINTYFNHIAEEWVTENEVAIESTLRTELTSEFIDGLKSLFQEHYIEIPEVVNVDL